MKDNGQEAKRKFWSYCGERKKRWEKKQGVKLITYVHPATIRALKEAAKKAGKAEWKAFQSAIEYGAPHVLRRGL